MSTTHSVKVTIEGSPDLILPVISGTLTIEENRSPRMQARLTCPATAALLALDPQRYVIWATVEAQVTTRIDLIRDISRRVAALTVGGLSALLTGKTISQVIPTLLAPATSSATWFLQLRTVDEHWARDTITLGFKSAEAILIDHKQPHASKASVLVGATILAAVNEVLAICNLPALTVADAAASGATTSDTLPWDRGVSAYEKVSELARAADLILFVDSSGGMQLQKASWIPPGTLALTSTGAERSVIDGGQYIDRDNSEFGTAVDNHFLDTTTGTNYGQAWTFWNALWPDWANVQPKKPYKTIYRKTTKPRIFGNFTAQQAKRAWFQGRGWKVQAVSDYTATASQAATVTRPSGVISGFVRTVEFSWPEDEMKIDLREAIPAGLMANPVT